MDNMLGKFIELVNWIDDLSNRKHTQILGPVRDLVEKMSDPSDRMGWRKELTKFLRKEPCWIANLNSKVVQVNPAPMFTKPKKWTVDDEGNIHFTLTSNGFTREQWEQHLKRRGCRIGNYALQVLCRASEAPTNGVTYNIVVRPGKKISDSDRITKKIRAAADKKGWLKPHWEVACLIRDTFTDEQLEVMGLWYIVTMHEPIKYSGGDPYLLGSYVDSCGRRLGADYGRPGVGWNDGGGFAFDETELLRKQKLAA